MIIGTAAYMAPEQARGRPVDKRADVWAFGVVLFEMLTGKQAFAGEDISDTLATVIKFDPDWNRLPADTPASIRRLLKRCLAKDPKQRLRECGSALLDIREALSGDGPDLAATITQPTPAPRRSLLPLLIVGAIAAAAGALAWAGVTRFLPGAPRAVHRFSIVLPEGDTLPQGTGSLLAVSRDGRVLVYKGARNSTRQLFRRSLDAFQSTLIPGSDNAGDPALSPDGRWVAFTAGGVLKKVALAGGAPQQVATLAAQTRGIDWGIDDRLLIAINAGGTGLLQVPAAGGELTKLFKPPERARVWYPQVLQEPQAVLFSTLMTPGSNSGEVHVIGLDGTNERKILDDALAARVLPSGHLIFLRSGSLWAVPFDSKRLTPIGAAVPVVEGVRVEGGGAVQFDVSDDGTLVYVAGTMAIRDSRTLQFIANSKPVQVPAAEHTYASMSLSPDETKIAVQIDLLDAADVWVVDVERGTLTRVTSEAGYDGAPLWTPDGRSIVYSSFREGAWSLSRKAADGTGTAESIASLGTGIASAVATSWTPDGSLVVTRHADVGVIAPGTKEWRPLIATSPATENQAVISPDAKWIAYSSNDTGGYEVYLQRFPALGERQAVSVGGGHSPTWSRDGTSLTYLRGGPPRDIMRVTVETTRDGRARLSAPVRIADWTYYDAQYAPRYYDLARDGRMIVIGLPSGPTPPAAREINVVVNWFDELKRLAPIP